MKGVDVMSIEEMRKAVSEQYGEGWTKYKSDREIAAIYYSMVGRGQVKKNTYDPYKNFKRFD